MIADWRHWHWIRTEPNALYFSGLKTCMMLEVTATGDLMSQVSRNLMRDIGHRFPEVLKHCVRLHSTNCLKVDTNGVCEQRLRRIKVSYLQVHCSSSKPWMLYALLPGGHARVRLCFVEAFVAEVAPCYNWLPQLIENPRIEILRHFLPTREVLRSHQTLRFVGVLRRTNSDKPAFYYRLFLEGV